MEIRFSVLVVSIVLLALNAAVQLSTLAAVQGLAAQQHAVSPPTDAAALEIALNERRLAFVLATDAKFDQPTNRDQRKLDQPYIQPATNPWCSEWGGVAPRSSKAQQPELLCNAANVVLMNDVEMVEKLFYRLESMYI